MKSNLKTNDIVSGTIFKELKSKVEHYVLYIGTLDVVENVGEKITVDKRYIYISCLSKDEAESLAKEPSLLEILAVETNHKRKIRPESIVGKVSLDSLKDLYKRTEQVLKPKSIIWWK